MKKSTLYIGCALSNTPGIWIQSVSDLKNRLREHYDVLDFYGTKAGTFQEVYEMDRKCVETTDYFLALCDMPSLGLGFEIGLAVELGKPILAVAHINTNTSRMIQGITAPHFEFQHYTEFSDIPELLGTFIQKHS